MWGGTGSSSVTEVLQFSQFLSCVYNTTLNSTHPSFIHPSICPFMYSFTFPFFKQLRVPEEGHPHLWWPQYFQWTYTSGYKWRVYITSLGPTAAGTIPLLSPLIWLSPSLLATEGQGYYRFVAFESSVLSELPSFSSSSQITGGGFLWPHLSSHQKRWKGGSSCHIIEYIAMGKPNKAKS